jgi:hypothetical protein
MNSLYVIEETNLSRAWGTAVQRIIDTPGTEIIPLLLTLTGFEEDENVRAALDHSLMKSGKGSIQTVSETIFPSSLYKLAKGNRQTLYDLYNNNLPRLKKIDLSNRNGTYFERMIAYDSSEGKINQLEVIISSLQSKNIKRQRRSKLQVSIFDPRLDHTNGVYQGFPCLQHVTFFISENGGLVLNSFYAIQYLYRRSYGNWLGLINLGKFIANELNIELERLNCYVGVEKWEVPKGNAKKILKKINKN